MPANPRSAPSHSPAAISDGKQAAPADATRSRPDPIALSPAAGPLPPIYLPPPGQPGPAGLLWHAAIRAVRRAAQWAVRHLSQHDQACQARNQRPPASRGPGGRHIR
jgi:hypothetical protein